MKFPLFPDQASTIARPVDQLYFALTGLSGLMVLIIFLTIAFFLFKYRRGKNVNRAPARIPQTTIEVTWIIILFLLMMGVFAWGAHVFFQQQRVPPGAMEINVVGKQWMWKVQHPEGNREINELHVPVGRNVRLTIASQDVIHSFYVPAFRTKMDVVPGRYTTEWFQARKIGTYHLFCAEYCGTKHSAMVGRIVVMDPADYENWLSAGRPANTMAQEGERLFRELGCSGCHIGRSVIRSPPLEGLYGKPVPLQTGQVVQADERYIRDSILLPNNQITAGYQPLMPTYQGHVTEDEVLQLIAYIKALGPRTREGEQ
jgi:cytochrome c oxidase subunit II